MANYLVQSCINEISYVVDFGIYTSNVGEVWSFQGPLPSDPILCGSVIEITTDAPTHNVISLHGDCCKCYQESGYISLKFQDCSNNDNIVFFDLTTFCDVYGNIPIQNAIFRFLSDPVFCVNF